MIDAESRATRALQILEDPLFVEACDKIERAAIEDMLNVPWWRIRRLSDHCARIRAIRDARAELRSVMLTGTSAARRRERNLTVA